MEDKSVENNYKVYVLLFVVILLQLAIIVYHMNIRTVVNADETWTFGFANSYGYPFFFEGGSRPSPHNNFFNKWHDGTKWFNYITVQPNERFSFNNVYRNQSLDCHPPFYYFLVHFICSLFPNKFSLWYGYIINIIAFIITQFFIFKLSFLLLKSSNYSIAVVLFFGFTMAALNTYIYIGSYSMLTMFTVIITYLCSIIINNSSLDSKLSISLFVVVLLGFLTHHYFALYFFPLSVGLVFNFVKKNNYKLIIKYSSLTISAFILYYIYFPYVFSQYNYMSKIMTTRGIFGEFPFKELFTSFSFVINYTIGIEQEKIISLFRTVTPFFNPLSPFATPFIVMLVIFCFFFFIIKKEKTNTEIIILLECIIGSIITSSYAILNMRVYFGRYYFPLMPLFCILFFIFIEWILKKITTNPKLKDYILYTLIIIFVLASHNNSAMEYCLTIKPSRDEMVSLFKGASIISVQPTGSEDTIHTKAQEYMFAKRVFPTREYEADEIEKAVKSINSQGKNYIIVPENEYGILIINMLKKLGVKPRYLFTDNHPIYDQIVLEIYENKTNNK